MSKIDIFFFLSAKRLCENTLLTNYYHVYIKFILINCYMYEYVTKILLRLELMDRNNMIDY